MAAPSNTLLKPGDVIAETYEIVKEIGRGGVGAVFLANHRRLPGKRFALKALLSASETVQARFRREAESASRRGHPNIVEVVDWNTLPDGSPYLVMEFLEGESLEDRMRRGPLTLEATCTIVRQIGSALAAAHRAGVVHRDLKPANVFLSPTDAGGTLADRVKVLDFGIARMRDIGLKGSLYWATASATTVFRTRRYPFAVVAALLADTASNQASTSFESSAAR